MIAIIIAFLYFLISGLVGSIMSSIDDDFPEELIFLVSFFWVISVPVIIGVVLGKLIVKIFKHLTLF
jgi:hypothetical protein